MDYWDKLAEGAGDRVDRRQLADSKCCHQRTDAFYPGIGVNRIPLDRQSRSDRKCSNVTSIEFIAVPNPRQPARLDIVQSYQVKVTGQAMEGTNAKLVQACVQILDDIHF